MFSEIVCVLKVNQKKKLKLYILFVYLNLMLRLQTTDLCMKDLLKV